MYGCIMQRAARATMEAQLRKVMRTLGTAATMKPLKSTACTQGKGDCSVSFCSRHSIIFFFTHSCPELSISGKGFWCSAFCQTCESSWACTKLAWSSTQVETVVRRSFVHPRVFQVYLAVCEEATSLNCHLLHWFLSKIGNTLAGLCSSP